MSSRFLRMMVAIAVALCAQAGARELRVCGDPDNMPLSREDGSGFENRIAELVAAHLGADLAWYWLPDRRGFLRKTLNAHVCDVVIGLPAESERALTTPAYYRGTYVFVHKATLHPRIASLDDPRLSSLRIGVSLVGNDLAATPPALSLARRGLVDNVVGFVPFGDRPLGERMTDAVRAGAIDVALLWSAQAGYWASGGNDASTRLDVTPLEPSPGVATAIDIAMGVRREDPALRDELTRALRALKPRIDAVLDAYRVARLPP